MGHSCIYEIRSPSGGVYVGSAVDHRARWRVHRHLLSKGKHHSPALQRAFLKYGQLQFAILFECRVEDLLYFEQRVIDAMKPRYNVGPVAGRSFLGLRHSDETRKKCGAANIGRKHPAEWRAAMSQRLAGNKFSLGRKQPLEEIEKRTVSLRGTKHRDCLENRLSVSEKAAIKADYLSGIGHTILAKRYRTDPRWMRRLLVALDVNLRS